MITASKAFIAFCVLAVLGTALVIGPAELRRLLPGTSAAKPEARAEVEVVLPKAEAKPETKPEAKPEPKLADAAPSAPAPAASKPPGALAETQTQATAALTDLAPVKAPPAAAEAGPRFDVARIDDHGEAAVIAGQAAPGAKVELLRDGQPLDTVVADASGQFVMTPPQLPAGSYELTLRAKAPDGTVTQSGRSVPVTIAEAAPPPARLASARPDAAPAGRPETKPDQKQDIVAALPSVAPRLGSTPDRPVVHQRMMGAVKPRVMARATAADIVAGAPSEPGTSRVISRGDSLWAISRLAYGDGSRYALIFNANRAKIHNPNLIYPGQTFVLPQKMK
ncbi:MULTISPECIES: LysM peptidoglycan-binding domain-containing protein [unclassified Bradyrhizobium]|uniref:LysM peptidoglycan-binding domain-containing protein n=1 Tax=unclassified Bradyrhizobium TaxID=2631580 RepID=UPI00247A0E01|nr:MULTISPECIES: LysM peptidoglycan-binding domain-containing protein [unclassified Bradyrhizobium]WGR71818.1 LysM peptidoglycan-binding domain-containing protein [Bradyrhizobium sp. ISRA426]WGR76653.1 LysM peptidoglycan-binding domain-containing protein [Bradyrhizobium sp. ISRA430]WGR87058.1 LysM peptidoglycan-binding domain-containing protein [Bradyrhizobium sp. ISRA432]